MKPVINSIVTLLTKYVISVDKELVLEIIEAATKGAVEGSKK